MSARRAAEEAGLSEGRWRQIVKGYQSAGGVAIPVHGPAETVARMAFVVGVTADEMETVGGRPDAAEEMRRPVVGMEVPQGHWDVLDYRAMHAELKAWLEASDEEWPDPPPTSALLFWEDEQIVESLRERQKMALALVRHQFDLNRERAAEIARLKERLAKYEAVEGGDGDADAGGSAPMNEGDDEGVHLDVAAYDPDEEK